MRISDWSSDVCSSDLETTPTFLDSYWLTNASIAYRTGPVEVALFATNLFNTEYFESYIEQTTLALAGLPPPDLGITDDRRRSGCRASLKFSPRRRRRIRERAGSNSEARRSGKGWGRADRSRGAR